MLDKFYFADGPPSSKIPRMITFDVFQDLKRIGNHLSMDESAIRSKLLSQDDVCCVVNGKYRQDGVFDFMEDRHNNVFLFTEKFRGGKLLNYCYLYNALHI